MYRPESNVNRQYKLLILNTKEAVKRKIKAINSAKFTIQLFAQVNFLTFMWIRYTHRKNQINTLQS